MVDTMMDDQPINEQAFRLTEAATRLQEAIADLTRNTIMGNAVEREEARDRFEIALATYSELIDTR